MHRIYHSTATAEKLFTEGSPGTGIPATKVTADIMNAFQEELATTVEGAGIALIV